MKHSFGFIGKMISSSLWTIEGAELFHLEKVLRLKVGDQVELIDGMGNFATGALTAVSKSLANVQIASSGVQKSSDYPLVVAIGALRHGDLDEVLPSLVELGIDEIAVFRTQVNEKNRLNESAMERWMRIVHASCKQSKRAHFPSVQLFPNLEQVFENHSQGLKSYFFDEVADSYRPIQLAPVKTKTMLVVGSESGLGVAERETLKTHGAQAVRFGDFIMRATTAAVVAATILQNARINQNP